MNKYLSLLIVILSVACLYVLFFWQPAIDSHSKLPELSKPMGGDFTLKTVSGPVSLKDYRGKVVLIYFGYTMCPDICPTNLAMMSNAFNQMNDDELGKVQGMFVSVDPQRDTLERLQEYTQYFHPSIMGMSSTPEIIRELADRYGAAYQKAEQKTATNYSVDHSSETYVIDPKGNLVERLPHAAPPAEILAAIKKYSVQ
ncbi:MAG: SCO family protein [Gammaproteobacteria bacterium]|nr:SCO family protein [Gammaproteobacteria bacterium]